MTTNANVELTARFNFSDNNRMHNLAFIDIEATSADSQRADIIEIAFVIKNARNEVVDHFHSLIKPTRPIPLEIAELTGITDQMVESAPEFHQIAERVLTKLASTKLVAHKAQFDVSILKKKFSELGMDFQCKTLCTLSMAKSTAPGLRSYSLASLCAFFGIPLKKGHRALEDAEATMGLYEVLSLLAGKGPEGMTEKFLPGHKKLISNARAIPGIVTFLDKDAKAFHSRAVENIKKELEQKLQLNAKNKLTIASLREIKIKETGSLARALIHQSKKETTPTHSIYSFRGKNGELILRCGKVNPQKSALFYFNDKKEALCELRNIHRVVKGDNEITYAYQESPKEDKSEIAKRNVLLADEIKKRKPEVRDMLIRSNFKVSGRYQYVLVKGHNRYALFESENTLERTEDIDWEKLKLKKLGPLIRRALELSLQYTRNQRIKTESVIKLRRLS